MLDDVTVDTNVFLHSANEQELRCIEARSFLQDLVSATTCLCIDEGFDTNESRNRSIIGGEYFANLRFVHTAFAIIVALGRTGRIVQLKKTAGEAKNRKISQLISKKTDRIFLKVSCNSKSKVFVSHDFKDFSEAKRTTIRNTLGINTIEASQARNLNE